MAMSKATPSRWSKALLEAAVIVGSILLAFWIDAWWEHRQELAVEASLIQAVAGELGVNRLRLSDRIEGMERDSRRHDLFMRSTPPELRELHVDSVRPWAASLYTPRTFDAGTVAAGALLETPPVDSETSLEVRLLLGRWLRSLEDAREEAAQLFRFMEPLALRVAELAVPVGAEGLGPVPRLLSHAGTGALVTLRSDTAFVAQGVRFAEARAAYLDDLRAAAVLLDSASVEISRLVR
jgi:hypothetical protein